MKKYVFLVLLSISLNMFAYPVVNGVMVYQSRNSPGAGGAFNNNSMIRLFNPTNQSINCSVTQNSSGQWKTTGWILPAHFVDLPLPVGSYNWTCWY